MYLNALLMLNQKKNTHKCKTLNFEHRAILLENRDFVADGKIQSRH